MASSRYRVYGWARILTRSGYKVRIIFQHVSVFRKSNFIKRVFFLFRSAFLSGKADIIIFHKYFPPVLFQKLLCNKKIIFDFDDRIYNEKYLLNKKSRFSSFLQLSNRIFVSVGSLKDEISSFIPAFKEKIVIIPTLIDLKIISNDLKLNGFDRKESKVRIGWVGTSGGLKYLELIEESLSKLANEFKDEVSFSVISDKPFYPEQFSFPINNIKWSCENEYKYFRDLDISVMPLDDSRRAESKAGFKIIQSMACGIPVVASAVGFNKDIISQGENGFLAESPDDFYIYIKRLIIDTTLRKEMGKNALNSVKKFDYQLWIDIYLRQIGENIE